MHSIFPGPAIILVNNNNKKHLSDKMSFISQTIILLTDQHSPRGNIPEIMVLTLRGLSWKYLPTSIRKISKGKSLLVLFVPHKIIKYSKHSIFDKLIALRKAFSMQSPPIPKFNLSLKYFFHTLSYVVSGRFSDYNNFENFRSSSFCYIVLILLRPLQNSRGIKY